MPLDFSAFYDVLQPPTLQWSAPEHTRTHCPLRPIPHPLSPAALSDLGEARLVLYMKIVLCLAHWHAVGGVARLGVHDPFGT